MPTLGAMPGPSIVVITGCLAGPSIVVITGCLPGPSIVVITGCLPGPSIVVINLFLTFRNGRVSSPTHLEATLKLVVYHNK